MPDESTPTPVLQREYKLNRHRVNACCSTLAEADRCWLVLQALTQLVAYVQTMDQVPVPLRALLDVKIVELGRGIDGLLIGDFLNLTEMSAVTRAGSGAYMLLPPANTTWTHRECRALLRLRDELLTRTAA